MTIDQPPTRRSWPRYSLRWLLLLIVPLSMVFAVYGYHYRQRVRAARAYIAICDKGVDANFHAGTDHVIIFKNANVTDGDLEAFLPAFGDYARSAGIGEIMGLKLNGSRVSAEALRRFRQAVPDCKVDP